MQTIKQDDISDFEVEAHRVPASGKPALEIEHLRISEGRLTYHDLPRVVSPILAHDDAVADLYSRNHFAAIIVDEFQDLTPQQLRIINRIGTGKLPMQVIWHRIYSFAGADPAQDLCGNHSRMRRPDRILRITPSSPAVSARGQRTGPNSPAESTSSALHVPLMWPGGGLLPNSTTHRRCRRSQRSRQSVPLRPRTRDPSCEIVLPASPTGAGSKDATDSDPFSRCG